MIEMNIVHKDIVFCRRFLFFDMNQKKGEVLGVYAPYLACSPRMSPNPRSRLEVSP